MENATTDEFVNDLKNIAGVRDDLLEYMRRQPHRRGRVPVVQPAVRRGVLRAGIQCLRLLEVHGRTGNAPDVLQWAAAAVTWTAAAGSTSYRTRSSDSTKLVTISVTVYDAAAVI